MVIVIRMRPITCSTNLLENWRSIRELLQARVHDVRLIEGQCRNRVLPQAALFTEALGRSKTECRALLQLRNF